MANFNQSPSGQDLFTAPTINLATLAQSEAAGATTAALMPRGRYVRPQDGRRQPLLIPEPR